MPATERQRQYWHKTQRLTGGLLLLWLAVTLLVCLGAGLLDFTLLGWPFGFWAAAQGALVVFCGIIWAYARAMNRLDQAYGAVEED